MTDAVVILGDLFRGEEGIVCPQAADFTADGRVNITDPIALAGRYRLEYNVSGSAGKPGGENTEMDLIEALSTGRCHDMPYTLREELG